MRTLEVVLSAADPDGIMVFAALDHEEVGSQSFKRASSSFLADVLGRIAEAVEIDQRRAKATSWLLSADITHAWNALFAANYDDANALVVNGGPAVYVNANERHSGDGATEADFATLCERARVSIQRYVPRSDMPCGSTIGLVVASPLGVPTLDINNPLGGMYSLREPMCAHDHALMGCV